ncbi:unnamed protein product [Hymenolepis diminuta]|uniref:Uncharacterized protein n=1 Tax=Hymenolepis diminuta TaxID=6216 RepID=A0A564YYZ9_HYMDI|nr:unnamed protein product [Hymenolepis diminuta]
MLVERREGMRDTRIQSGVNHTLANAYYSTCANRAQGDINPLSHRSSIHPFHTVSHRFSMYVCTRRLPSQQTSCVSILIGLLRGYAVSSRRPVAVPLFIAAFMTNRPEHSPKTHGNVERGQIQVHFKLSHKVIKSPEFLGQWNAIRAKRKLVLRPKRLKLWDDGSKGPKEMGLATIFCLVNGETALLFHQNLICSQINIPWYLSENSSVNSYSKWPEVILLDLPLLHVTKNASIGALFGCMSFPSAFELRHSGDPEQS